MSNKQIKDSADAQANSADHQQQTSGHGPWGHTEYDQTSQSAAKVLKPEENDKTTMPCKNSLPT